MNSALTRHIADEDKLGEPKGGVDILRRVNRTFNWVSFLSFSGTNLFGVWRLVGVCFGGATIFGLIVAAGAWINGRLTRREISRLIREERQATRN